jgi:hypothetical protein
LVVTHCSVEISPDMGTLGMRYLFFSKTILWSNQLKKSDVELFYGEKMNDSRPVRCQKCGKPLGYVTVLAKGLISFQQPIQNVKIVAICMDCYQKK